VLKERKKGPTSRGGAGEIQPHCGCRGGAGPPISPTWSEEGGKCEVKELKGVKLNRRGRQRKNQGRSRGFGSDRAAVGLGEEAE